MDNSILGEFQYLALEVELQIMSQKSIIQELVLIQSFLACEIEQMKRFSCGGYCDDSTIVYLQHPCVILTALEVKRFKDLLIRALFCIILTLIIYYSRLECVVQLNKQPNTQAHNMNMHMCQLHTFKYFSKTYT